jgi:murein L,D-transpeptidase YcbB/YkuD
VQARPRLWHGAPPRQRRHWAAFGFALTLTLWSLPAAADPPAPPVDLDTTPPTLSPYKGDAAIEDRLDIAGHVVIAGARLHEHLVRRFYAAHGWRPVWDNAPQTAAALLAEVARADRHGLDPALFDLDALRGAAHTLSPIERDLLVSDAILSYADALAEGAMPVGARPEIEDLHPPPVDVIAVVGAALTAPDPAATIEALAPASPDYVALQRAYRAYLDAAAVAAGREPASEFGLSVPRLGVAEALQRARQIAVNLERLRWLPRELPPDRLVVDTASEQLQLFRDNVPVFTTRVVVGEFDKQTPELQSIIKDVLFNPPWNIPPSIVRKEILPKLAVNRHYLAEHFMRWRGPMSIQQEAGPHSALGRLKFEMDDAFDVYLHDTPEKWRFSAAERMMSHGCVRVQNPRELAAMLLGVGRETIDQNIDTDRTHRRKLPRPIPVFIVYRTAIPESDGSVAFRGDPYDRDGEIWAYLSRAHRGAMAQKSAVQSATKAKHDQGVSTIAQKSTTIGD